MQIKSCYNQSFNQKSVIKILLNDSMYLNDIRMLRCLKPFREDLKNPTMNRWCAKFAELPVKIDAP